MNQFEYQLWKEVYANCIKEYFDHDIAQGAANESVQRLRLSDVALDRRQTKESELSEGGEVA